MRHTKDIGVPRRSGVVGLVKVPMLVKVADPSEAGMPDERGAGSRTNGWTSSPAPPIYRLLVYDDSSDLLIEPREEGARLGDEGEVPFDLGDIITIEEVAAVLHVRRVWIVRRTRKLPFVKQMSRKKYVCSRILLRRWRASGSGPLKAA